MKKNKGLNRKLKLEEGRYLRLKTKEDTKIGTSQIFLNSIAYSIYLEMLLSFSDVSPIIL